MLIRISRKNWPIVVLISGMAILYEFLPTYIENLKLEGNKSTITAAVVKGKRTYHKSSGHSGASATYYEVQYRFQVDKKDYVGRYDSQSDELRRVRKGDIINVQYALRDPTCNRPAAVSYYTPWLTFWNIVAVVLIAIGATCCFFKYSARNDLNKM